MNETDRLAAIIRYIEQTSRELASGQATEHSYRPALKELLGALDESIEAINEPKQSEHGAPDFVIIGKKNVDDLITTYPVAGDNVVEKPRFAPRHSELDSESSDKETLKQA